MSLKEELQSIVSGEVSDDPAVLKAASRDASVFEITPQVVVSPKDSNDLGKLVNFVTKHKDRKLSLTPRSAGTDMSGGPLTESIVLDMKPYFNHIGRITSTTATTEPGVFYRDFERATLKHDRLMPSYPASRELCTVGGMVGTNAAGEKTLSYGKVADYVQQLTMVLHDGKEYSIEPLTKLQLKKKMERKTVEGEIYRKVYKLIESNYDLIHAAKPNVSKNSAGYALWDVWDRNTFDLTRLFTGSQGTLGIITNITFKVVRPKMQSRMLIIFLHDLTQLAEIVNRVLKHNPESFESYDDHTLKLAIRYFPEIAARIKSKSTWELFHEFLPEFTTLLKIGRLPKLVLLAEFTGDSIGLVNKQVQAAEESLEDLDLQTMITKNRQEGKKYWVVRRESFSLLRNHIKHKHSAPFIDDVTVRPEQLPQFLPELQNIMSKYNLVFTLAGHIGDANFHIFPLMDMSDPKVRAIIPKLSQEVFELVFKYKGSMSGEHNDGIIRTPFLEQMYGAEVVKLFKEVKQIFDPNNIFNPGKKVDISMDYAVKHFLHGNNPTS